jgi:glyoxylase-like metal-dependent hydrolase (beta-lactamase superfamily II)
VDTVWVGNVEIASLFDGPLPLPLWQFAVPVHRAAMEGAMRHLADEHGQVIVPMRCYLLRTEGRVVLLDSGFGPRPDGGVVGCLDRSLRNAGVDPCDIEVVLNTHLHHDHVGWNIVDGADGIPAAFFPNAEHVFQQAEWDYWMTPERLADPANAHLRRSVAPLPDLRPVRFVTGEVTIGRDLTFVSTPGHTPGHVAIGIQSSGERAIIIGDASHYAEQLDHPEWSPVWDADPHVAADTRRKLFDEAEADGRLVAATHYPGTGMGRVVRLSGRRVFRSVAVSQSGDRDPA